MNEIQRKYKEEIVPAMMKTFSYVNIMEVPRVEKVVLNMGLGDALENARVLDTSMEELARITGQKPVLTRARKSIANFKLREGNPIGCRVTLRKQRMYDFLYRLLNIALPRVRDFKGASPRGFDGRGNYTLGVREQLIFPEINYDDVEKIKGMNITIVTSAKTDEEAKELLNLFGVPFRK
ncbi:MAG: 50S ribosomal protein L5 [bacterium]|nr:50S ribosomal protein L5 [bacterium]MDT8395892.1 50S ribosomal protein L5 [bacterium]